jgi:hypothetical protein
VTFVFPQEGFQVESSLSSAEKERKRKEREREEREKKEKKKEKRCGRCCAAVERCRSADAVDAADTTTPSPTLHPINLPCLDEAKAAKDSEREAPSDTARSCETTSRESPSLQSVVWQGEVVSSASVV